MPLTDKGKKIMGAMEAKYGKNKAKNVFYASRNKGVIKGVEHASRGKLIWDVGKKYMPKAGKAIQKKFKELYNDYRIHMSETSAAMEARRDVREHFPHVYKHMKTPKKSTGGLIDYYKDIL